MNIAQALATLALVWLMLVSPPAAAGRVVGGWAASGIANVPAESVRLTSKNKEVVATVARLRVVRLIDVLTRIEAAAGVSADLFVVQMDDGQPNAFAAVAKDGRNVVAVTPAMLELLGDDADAYAAVIGHELAHLARKHRADRASRQGLLQGLGAVATLLIAARTGTNASALVDLSTAIVDRSYSRDEEREADRLGIEYAAGAGFDPRGAVRLFERMGQAAQGTTLAFLSTHPASEERVASVQQIIESLPAEKRAGGSRAVEKWVARGMLPRGNWYGLLAAAEEQLRLNPEDGFWWYHLGLAHEKLGRPGDAVPALSKSLQHEPGNANAYMHLGFNYVRLKELDKATEALEGAVRVAPQDANAWYGLGVVYHQRGLADRVWEVHQELKKLDAKRAEQLERFASIPQQRPQASAPGAGEVLTRDASPPQDLE
jgi:predicted Zn-dependent protease